MCRDIIKKIIYLLVRVLSRLEVVGLENIPSSGAGIFAPNHVSILDPAIVFAVVSRKDITALVAKKHQKNPFLKWLVNNVNGIWLNREEADAHALRASLGVLQKGGMVGIAPEGTRSKTGGLIRAKTGVAYLANKAGVPVIPVAITGTRDAVQKILHLHRPKIKIEFGKPLYFPPINRKERESALEHHTEEIMLSIASMLPEDYQGVYASRSEQISPV